MAARYKPRVLLGTDSHVMQWNPVLHIYRVNRYQVLSLEEKVQKARYDSTRLDFIEEFLARNLDHCAEAVFSYFTFKDLIGFQLVCQLWNKFIGFHIFKQRVEHLVAADESLQELAQVQGWSGYLFKPLEEVSATEPQLYKTIYSEMLLLNDIWRFREPKAKRLFCDSFVLSVRADNSTVGTVFCGLNNGCVQAWDLSSCARIREEECHEKGVKCIDLNDVVFLTGSYDTTFKVWRRDDWTCIRCFPLHKDSVWDLKLHDRTVATAGLDGAVILYDFESDYKINSRCYIQAHGDLVSAVDFGQEFLVAGFEDASLGVWQLQPVKKLHMLTGHNGGVTGVQLQYHLAATSSYDTLVKLWDVRAGTCLLTLTDHDNFARCVCFIGNRIVSGDFGGNVLMWDLSFQNQTGKAIVKNHRKWTCHKGHVVCLQLNAQRIISGSRDRTLMINDFWMKVADNHAKCREARATNVRHSRFL